MKKEIQNIEEEFETKCEEEMRYISGVFMLQGDTKARDIIIPTTELSEVSDRLCLYCFAATLRAKKETTKQILEKQNEKLRKLDLNTYCAEDIIAENNKIIKNE